MSTKEQDHEYWLERKSKKEKNKAFHKECFEYFARKSRAKLRKLKLDINYGECELGGCDTAGEMPCYKCKYWQKLK
ncbi:MAG: hypothetical protein RR415_12360 [Ruthenibacterium sp.]